MPLETLPLFGRPAAQCGGAKTIRPGERQTILGLRTGSVSAVNLGVVLGIEEDDRPDEGACDLSGLDGAFLLSRVRAHLLWGIGNTSFRAQCDLLRGTQLNIVAENLQVDAEYVTTTRPWDPPPRQVLDLQPTFTVSAGLGYTGIGRNSNPARLTEVVQVEEPGGSCSVRVPPFATSLTVLPVGGGQAEAHVLGLGTAYEVRWVVSSPLSNAGQYDVENALPLFDGARTVEVRNIAPVGSLVAFVVFGLAL